MLPPFRIGMGYDVHPLRRGRPLILGGARIPHTHGLFGHSDADVLSHAVGEAVLGAAGLGDLGRHFPPGDPAFKNISSLVLLERIAKRISRRGWKIAQIDSTLLLQAPRIGPYLEDMGRRIARSLSIPTSAVNVKAKSPEGLGFVGRRQGVSAWAVALLHVTSR